MDIERANIWKCGMRGAVEARRKQRRQQEQNTGLEQSKQGKQVRFDEEEQLEEMRTENAEVVMDGVKEVRSGRGRMGLVPGGEDRNRADETRKGKVKGNGGKGEHEGKGGGVGRKGTQLVENLVTDEDQENMTAMKSEEEEEDHREQKGSWSIQKEDKEQEEQRDRVAPNMGAGGSHPQAM